MPSITHTHAILYVALVMASTFIATRAQAQTCGDAQRAPCAALRKTFDEACASSMPNYGTSPAWWLERVTAFSPAYETLTSKKATLDQCAACGDLSSSWEETCTRRRDEIGESWGDFVADEARESYQLQSYLKRTTKDKRYPEALRSIDERIASVEGTREATKTLKFEADTGALDERLGALRAQRAEIQRAHEEQLASVRCPKKGKRHAGHLATARAFFARDPRYAKEVHSLRVTGKSGQRYDRPERTTYETLPVTACVEDAKAAGGPRCYVWQLSVQRSKIDGDAWSRWDTVLVGAQQEMLCRNLKR